MSAIASVAFLKGHGIAVKNALSLLHTICGKAWDFGPSIFRQIESIGPKSIIKLGLEGIESKSVYLAPLTYSL
jgi:hypothetical protein